MCARVSLEGRLRLGGEAGGEGPEREARGDRLGPRPAQRRGGSCYWVPLGFKCARKYASPPPHSRHQRKICQCTQPFWPPRGGSGQEGAGCLAGLRPALRRAGKEPGARERGPGAAALARWSHLRPAWGSG